MKTESNFGGNKSDNRANVLMADMRRNWEEEESLITNFYNKKGKIAFSDDKYANYELENDDSFYADSNIDETKDINEAATQLTLDSEDIKVKRKKSELLDGNRKAQETTIDIFKGYDSSKYL